MLKLLPYILLLALFSCSKYIPKSTADYATDNIDVHINVYNKITSYIEIELSLISDKGEELDVSNDYLKIVIDDKSYSLSQQQGITTAHPSFVTLSNIDESVNEFEVHFKRFDPNKTTSIIVQIPKTNPLEQPQSYEFILPANKINISATIDPNTSIELSKQAICKTSESTINDIKIDESQIEIKELPVVYSIPDFLEFKFTGIIDNENIDGSVDLLLEDGQKIRNINKDRLILISEASANSEAIYNTRQLYESITCSASIMLETKKSDSNTTSLFNSVQVNSTSSIYTQFLIEL